jgi:hypothetical protein
MFVLPVVSLYLAEKNPEQAGFVYTQIQHSPFLARASIFQDMIYQYLPQGVKDQPGAAELAADQDDLNQRLWSTASSVLSTWELE